MVDAQLVHPKGQRRAMSYPASYGTNKSELLDSKEESAKSQNNTCFTKNSSYTISKFRGTKRGQNALPNSRRRHRAPPSPWLPWTESQDCHLLQPRRQRRAQPLASDCLWSDCSFNKNSTRGASRINKEF